MTYEDTPDVRMAIALERIAESLEEIAERSIRRLALSEEANSRSNDRLELQKAIDEKISEGVDAQVAVQRHLVPPASSKRLGEMD